MFCGNCGHHIPDTNNFCSKCGSPVSRNLVMEDKDDLAILRWKAEAVDYTNHGELTSVFPKIMKKRILIDLSKVNFIDSVGIGTLVTLYYKTTRTKQEIKIVGIPPTVRKAIKALGVDNILEIRDTKEQALADWGIIEG